MQYGDCLVTRHSYAQILNIAAGCLSKGQNLAVMKVRLHVHHEVLKNGRQIN
jgi:hypothetical protein